MSMTADYLWLNGEIMPWENGQVHCMTHGLHYGSSVYEGVRAYEIDGKPYLFRPVDHFKRFLFGCRVCHMASPLSIEEWIEITWKVLKANRHTRAYVRPLVFRGPGTIMLDGRSCPVCTLLATVPFGQYLGEESITRGVNVQVSSWRRISSNALSPMAKIGGTYINGQNIISEATDNGFDEGIVLDERGCVCEGGGENIFLLRNGKIVTPPVARGMVEGITRDSLMVLAKARGYEVIEQDVCREMLYCADEIFFTGTAAEVCAVCSVDRLPVGTGKPGPVTLALQKDFFDLVQGRKKDEWQWLVGADD